MEYFKLGDIFLGLNDGKKEALIRSDFERFFYDHENIHDQVMKPQNFLILGKKGSGKTILAEYINKTSKKDPLWFSEIRSYKDFKFHELVQLKSDDIKPNEYISIWEWVILLDLARLILQDQGIDNVELRNKLESFYTNNYYSIDIDSGRVVEITKENQITGTIPTSIVNLSAGHASKSTKVSGSYFNYLEGLREVVLGLLEGSSSKYTVFYDELDDRFRDNEFYKDGIISLIKAADKVNLELLRRNVDAKISILLRSDIFYILNDPDLNKIKMDNSLVIDWGNIVSQQSPLFKLILSKIRTSLPAIEKKSDDQLFSLLFPQGIKGIDPERYILERTLFRPRDVITMLNLIIKKYPKTGYFGWKGFIDIKKAYSEYFFQEIRNELCGHLSDKEIDQSTLMIKQYNKHFFYFDEIKEYHKKNIAIYPDINLEKILRLFFKFNIIGNTWFNKYKNRNYYCWAYRDNKAEVDFKKKFVIHLGLREELSL